MAWVLWSGPSSAGPHVIPDTVLRTVNYRSLLQNLGFHARVFQGPQPVNLLDSQSVL